MGKGNKQPAAPDPYKTAAAEAQFNRLDSYSPTGAGQVYGYTDANGQFVRGVPPQGTQAAVQMRESPIEKMLREAMEPAALELTRRVIADNLGVQIPAGQPGPTPTSPGASAPRPGVSATAMPARAAAPAAPAPSAANPDIAAMLGFQKPGASPTRAAPAPTAVRTNSLEGRMIGLFDPTAPAAKPSMGKGGLVGPALGAPAPGQPTAPAPGQPTAPAAPGQPAPAAPTQYSGGMPGPARVGDRGTVAQSIFDRTFSMMKPGIDQTNDRLMTNLQSRGLPIGGEAFNEAYGAQQRETQDTISRLAQDADINAGGEQSRLFGLDSAARSNSIAELVAAFGGGYNPPNAIPNNGAQGVNYSGLVGEKYRADMANYQNKQAQQSSTMGMLGSLGGALIKSDRRLKADIRRVGKRGSLRVYEWRYVWDEPGTVHRGYMAQEVMNTHPDAVFWHADHMVLDYAQLPEVA